LDKDKDKDKVNKVIGIDTDRSATYDFLLTLRSNHEHISYRFRDKRRFQSKIVNFPHPRIFSAPPAVGLTLELSTDAKGQNTRMTGLPDG